MYHMLQKVKHYGVRSPPKINFFIQHCTFRIRITRNTCTQQPLARLPNLFSVMLRLHTAINRADFYGGPQGTCCKLKCCCNNIKIAAII